MESSGQIIVGPQDNNNFLKKLTSVITDNFFSINGKLIKNNGVEKIIQKKQIIDPQCLLINKIIDKSEIANLKVFLKNMMNYLKSNYPDFQNYMNECIGNNENQDESAKSLYELFFYMSKLIISRQKKYIFTPESIFEKQII